MAALAARFPVEARATIVEAILIVFVFAAGVVIGIQYFHTHVVVQSHTRTVQRSWGRPDSTMPAAQVNAQLPSLGVNSCDIYGARKTVVCHP